MCLCICVTTPNEFYTPFASFFFPYVLHCYTVVRFFFSSFSFHLTHFLVFSFSIHVPNRPILDVTIFQCNGKITCVMCLRTRKTQLHFNVYYTNERKNNNNKQTVNDTLEMSAHCTFSGRQIICARGLAPSNFCGYERDKMISGRERKKFEVKKKKNKSNTVVQSNVSHLQTVKSIPFATK